MKITKRKKLIKEKNILKKLFLILKWKKKKIK